MKIALLDGSGLDLKYLLRSKDRHGNVRIYVRRFTNGPRIRIRALANPRRIYGRLSHGGRNRCRDGPGQSCSRTWLASLARSTVLPCSGIQPLARNDARHETGHPGRYL